MMMICVLLAVTLLGEGTCGVYSPDGGKIALQGVVEGKSRVGVLDRESRRFAWLEKVGNAAYPAWSPSGDAIVYTYGNETNTAWAAKDGETGYHLRIWRHSVGTSEITAGRFRDYMPSFSIDGGKIFFASTRCASPEIGLATRSGIYSVNLFGSPFRQFFINHSFHIIPSIFCAVLVCLVPETKLEVYPFIPKSKDVFHLILPKTKDGISDLGMKHNKQEGENQ